MFKKFVLFHAKTFFFHWFYRKRERDGWMILLSHWAVRVDRSFSTSEQTWKKRKRKWKKFSSRKRKEKMFSARRKATVKFVDQNGEWFEELNWFSRCNFQRRHEETLLVPLEIELEENCRRFARLVEHFSSVLCRSALCWKEFGRVVPSPKENEVHKKSSSGKEKSIERQKLNVFFLCSKRWEIRKVTMKIEREKNVSNFDRSIWQKEIFALCFLRSLI